MLSQIPEWLGVLIEYLCLLVLALSVCSMIPQYGWLFDLVSHFRVSMAWTGFAASLLAVLAGKIALAGLCSASALLILASLFPFRPNRNAISSTPHRMILFNVRMRNRAYDRTLRFILGEAPDMLALVEVDQAWIDNLLSLRDLFPYRACLPHPSSYGLAFFSRYPIQTWRAARAGTSDPDHLEVELELPTGIVHVILAHLPPPFTPSELKKRNDGLAHLGQVARLKGKPTLLMGDFNASPWTPGLLDVERSSGLRSLRRGHGLLASWPAPFWPTRIPIDHILGSGTSITFGNASLGPDLGSDHLPLRVELSIAKAGEASSSA